MQINGVDKRFGVRTKNGEEMLRVLGANICETRSGVTLFDGGACLLEDGKIRVAITEERLTRQKFDGGFIKSIPYCLEEAGISIADVDLFVFSVCCDRPLDLHYLTSVLKRQKFFIPPSKIAICPSHHLSHACSAFFVSPFDEAIIFISDGEGNVIDNHLEPDHWANRNERISYYLGQGNHLSFLGRDADGIGDLGLGNGYDYILTWIGFNLYQDAGKVMALAAYGETDAFEGAHIFTYENGIIKCLLEPIHTNMSLSVRRLIARYTGKEIGICKSTSLLNQIQKNIARLVQDDLEQILIKKTNDLVKETNVDKLCIAGGVGLNCVANSALLDKSSAKTIFIPPVPGDSGQCLGNALYGYHVLLKKPRIQIMTNAYYGKEYSNHDIEIALKSHAFFNYYQPDDIFLTTAELISQKHVIGWFQSRSEFGPRALGNRSILGDPRFVCMKDLLNLRVKHREQFRPFAPSVLIDKVNDYFEIDTPSPFMQFAPRVKPDKLPIIPAVVHIDGTARVQTVSFQDNPKFYNLILQFELLTGVPVLLNTSFNIAGEPIVESPEDALQCFNSTEIDFLVINDFLISKKSY